jgi:hypothetical protein
MRAAADGSGAGMGGGGWVGHATPAAPAAVLPTEGKAAVDLAPRLADLKTEERAEPSETVRTVAGDRFRKLGTAWVDQRFKPAQPTLRLRALGAACFRLLARHPEVKSVLALGERVT